MTEPLREDLQVQHRTAILVSVPDPSRNLGKEQALDELKGLVKTAGVKVVGELNRPPYEKGNAGAALYEHAKTLAAEIGFELVDTFTGGGSDGNFTAALGIPTLDGLGAVGEGAHATHESILVDRIADRVALLAKLTAAIE